MGGLKTLLTARNRFMGAVLLSTDGNLNGQRFHRRTHLTVGATARCISRNFLPVEEKEELYDGTGIPDADLANVARTIENLRAHLGYPARTLDALRSGKTFQRMGKRGWVHFGHGGSAIPKIGFLLL